MEYGNKTMRFYVNNQCKSSLLGDVSIKKECDRAVWLACTSLASAPTELRVLYSGWFNGQTSKDIWRCEFQEKFCFDHCLHRDRGDLFLQRSRHSKFFRHSSGAVHASPGGQLLINRCPLRRAAKQILPSLMTIWTKEITVCLPNGCVEASN